MSDFEMRMAVISIGWPLLLFIVNRVTVPAVGTDEGGPYRSADHVPDAGGMVDEPVFKTGDAVEVRHSTGDWYVAKFCGFTRISTGAVLVMLESADRSLYPIDSVEMRHARAS